MIYLNVGINNNIDIYYMSSKKSRKSIRTTLSNTFRNRPSNYYELKDIINSSELSSRDKDTFKRLLKNNELPTTTINGLEGFIDKWIKDKSKFEKDVSKVVQEAEAEVLSSKFDKIENDALYKDLENRLKKLNSPKTRRGGRRRWGKRRHITRRKY